MENYEMSTHDGACKYCGQVQPVLAADQEDANARISEECECGGAAREKKLNTLEENLKAAIGEKAIDNGFQPLSEKRYEYIRGAALGVFEQCAEKATFKVGNSTITIQETSKGAIKVSRTTSKNITAEA